MTTIRQIAEAARVSPGIVSQVLNGRIDVRPETRQRIVGAAEQLGYRRRQVGRPPLAEPRHHIAMLLSCSPSVTAPMHPMHRNRINALRDVVTAGDGHFSLLPANVPAEENWAFRDAVDRRDINAAVLDGEGEARGYASWLRDCGVPHVVLERTPPMNEFSCVCVDGVIGGQLAAERLFDRGCTSFAFVHRDTVFSWTHQRRHGFVNALTQRGRETVDVWSIDPDGPEARWDALCQTLLERGVDGIFASSDGMAIRLIDHLEPQGVTIPDDVAVVGFDEMEWTSASGLRPTSITYDQRHIAEVTVRVLKQLLDDPKASALAIYVRPELVVHDTA